MTLPSASTLTDEQLRVMCAELDGYKNAMPVNRMEGGRDVRGHLNGREHIAPNYLTDGNAALRLLGEHWAANALSREEVSVAIFRPGKTYIGEAPDFCRAIVLAYLRAEGKIL